MSSISPISGVGSATPIDPTSAGPVSQPDPKAVDAFDAALGGAGNTGATTDSWGAQWTPDLKKQFVQNIVNDTLRQADYLRPSPTEDS